MTTLYAPPIGSRSPRRRKPIKITKPHKMTTAENIQNKNSGKWFYAQCYFPYPDGYATARIIKGKIESLDFGLTKSEAIARCNELNSEKKEQPENVLLLIFGMACILFCGVTGLLALNGYSKVFFAISAVLLCAGIYIIIKSSNRTK